MKKDQLFKSNYARELLNVARDDLDAGNILRKANHKRKENIFFNYQQCIEKCLKALLCAHNKPVPMVHDLNLICDRLEDVCPVKNRDLIEDLSQFATIRRYEEGVVIASNEEILAVEEIAQEILEWTDLTLKNLEL
jgi:HEPN domain-containing protein